MRRYVGASLSKMWRDFEKEKSLGRHSVFVWVGLEMRISKTKKLEQEIEKLKDAIFQLQSQMLALTLSRPIAMTAPPISLPNVPTTKWPPYIPYIGDPPGQGWQGSTITCGSKTGFSGSDNNKISRCC